MLKLKPGVASVSFRPNAPIDIIKEASATGLDVIEWGGDIHSPHGDIERADELAALSAENDIALITYGSYFRLGKNTIQEFEGVLASAITLGTKVIRVWGSAYIPECSGELWDRSVSDAKIMCEMASKAGLVVALECHNGSVTEEYHCALEFMKAVAHPALRFYWQINEQRDKAYNLEAAKAFAPYLECIHTFYFKPDGKKGTLKEGFADWSDYLDIFKNNINDRTIPMLLEFMPYGGIETLEQEAESLIELIASKDMLDK